MRGKGGMHGEGRACMAKGACMVKGVCMVKGHAWLGCVCGTHAPAHTTRYSRSMCGQYASYWNAFLLTKSNWNFVTTISSCCAPHKQAVDAFSSGVINVYFGYFATNVTGSDAYLYYRIPDKSPF